MFEVSRLGGGGAVFMEVMALKGINKTFEVRKGFFSTAKFQALSDVNMTLNRGEIVGLVGASGSGKSTIANIILKILKPDNGQLIYDNEDVTNISNKELRKYRNKVQMIFQDPYSSLDPVHTVEWHVSRPLILRGIEDYRDEVMKILEEVYVEPAENFLSLYPHQLSGGLRQRVYIARVLAMNPELIIADEPTSMLDASIKAGIIELLMEMLEKRNLSILYITHDLSTVYHASDRIYVIHNGKIVESGNTNDVVEHPHEEYTRALIKSTPDPYRRIGD